MFQLSVAWNVDPKIAKNKWKNTSSHTDIWKPKSRLLSNSSTVPTATANKNSLKSIWPSLLVSNTANAWLNKKTKPSETELWMTHKHTRTRHFFVCNGLNLFVKLSKCLLVHPACWIVTQEILAHERWILMANVGDDMWKLPSGFSLFL